MSSRPPKNAAVSHGFAGEAMKKWQQNDSNSLKLCSLASANQCLVDWGMDPPNQRIVSGCYSSLKQYAGCIDLSPLRKPEIPDPHLITPGRGHRTGKT